MMAPLIVLAVPAAVLGFAGAAIAAALGHEAEPIQLPVAAVSVAAALASLEILRTEPQRIQKLIRNAGKMRAGFKAMGFKVIDGQTAIVPVIIGDDTRTFIFWRELFDAGVFVNAFISPGVPNGMQMLRTSYMATHEDEHLDVILETFGTIGKKLGLID